MPNAKPKCAKMLQKLAALSLGYYSKRPNKIVIAGSEARWQSHEVLHFVRDDIRFNVNLFKAFTMESAGFEPHREGDVYKFAVREDQIMLFSAHPDRRTWRRPNALYPKSSPRSKA
jgi:hypothetical protein